MNGPCAKTTVTCVLVCPNGERFTGTNYCNNPQPTCPREPGEGYAKCKTICRQPGHAEPNALAKAGDKARGARAYITGNTYACKDCQELLTAAGVISFTIGPAP